MYRILALAVIASVLALGSAMGSPIIGGGASVAGGEGEWSLASFELYSDWDENAMLTGRMGISCLPPLFPQEPPAIYLGLGMRLALGESIRGILFGSAGALIENLAFQDTKASLAGQAGVGLSIAVSEHLGFYMSYSFVTAARSEKLNQEDSPIKLYFPWSIGMTWRL